MKKLWITVAVVTLLEVIVMAEGFQLNFQTSPRGWIFRRGDEFGPGVQGNFKVIKFEGDAVGCLTGDFTKGGVYVAVYKHLPPRVNLKTMTITLKAQGLHAAKIQITDSTGQTFQHKFSISRPDEWNEIKLNSPQFPEFWGGAKDGKWHGPVKTIGLILDKGGLANGIKDAKLFIRSITIEE